MISKHEELQPKVAKITDKNPLNSIDLTVDVVYVEQNYPRDKRGFFKIHDKYIFQALKTLFNGLFINKGEIVPLTISDGDIILQIKVERIENITTENRHLTYGVLVDQTIINCKPDKKVIQTLKIQSDRIQEK